jgi:hypothetical protein
MNGYRGADAGWPFFVLHRTLVSVIAIESGSRASCPALARNSWRGGPSEWSLTGSRQTGLLVAKRDQDPIGHGGARFAVAIPHCSS